MSFTRFWHKTVYERRDWHEIIHINAHQMRREMQMAYEAGVADAKEEALRLDVKRWNQTDVPDQPGY